MRRAAAGEGGRVRLPVSIIETVRRVLSMAGELKALRAGAGANAADPVSKQAAPATTAESTTARCAQEREQANWASVRGAGGPVAVAAETGRAGGSVLARAAGHTGWHRLGIGGSDRHRHQEVGVLIHKRVQTAAIGDAVPPTCAVPQLMNAAAGRGSPF